MSILFIYCLVRFSFILVYEPLYFYETYTGTVAKEILSGLRLPLLDYAADPYGAGNIIAAMVTAPLFLFFGETLFALKLAPLLWHLLSLIAWFFVFRAWFTPIKTFLMLLFLALPPPRITEYFLLNQGIHFEMILWMALSILILKRFLDGRLSERKAGLMLGLLGGFSSWTILTNLVTAAVIWIYLAFVRGTKMRKPVFFAAYILFFLIGFSPLLLYNAKYGWTGMEIIEALFLTPNYSANYFLEQMTLVLKIGLRGLFGFRDLEGISRRIFMEGYTLLYLTALGALLFQKRKEILKPVKGLDLVTFGLLFQLLLISLTIIASWGYREYYFFPLVPFMGMTLVLAFGGLKRPIKFAILAFCILGGLAGNISYVAKRLPDFGRPLKMPGYSDGLLGYFVEARFGYYDFDLFQRKVRQALGGRTLKYKEEFFQNFTSGSLAIHHKEDLEQKILFVKSWDPSLQPTLFKKLGMQLGIYSDFSQKNLNDLLVEYKIDPSFYPMIYEGFSEALEEWR